MKKKINLYNRYKIPFYLEYIGKNEYRFCGPEEEMNYMRVGYFNKEENKEGYYFIDPSGGPYLNIGSEISGLEIKKIVSKNIDGRMYYVLTLEKVIL